MRVTLGTHLLSAKKIIKHPTIIKIPLLPATTQKQMRKKGEKTENQEERQNLFDRRKRGLLRIGRHIFQRWKRTMKYKWEFIFEGKIKNSKEENEYQKRVGYKNPNQGSFRK